MCHVHALRTVLARGALCDRAQARFGRGEGNERTASAQ
jgi:hypothetical protein